MTLRKKRVVEKAIAPQIKGDRFFDLIESKESGQNEDSS